MFGIHLYWWSLNRKDGKDNYGDILGPFIAKALSHKMIFKVSHPMDRLYRLIFKHYVTVGSIMCVVSKNSIVWGSGIIKKNERVRQAKFLVVRGPRTRNRLLELGYDVPEVYGDPALLLPRLIKNNIVKKYKLGIVPHYVDFEIIKSKMALNDEIQVIDLMTNDIIKTTEEILACEYIISSSLHGVIVSHAYQIPAIWIKFSDNLSGDNTKFYDYFESVQLNYEKEFYCNPEDLSKDFLIDILTNNQKILKPDLNLIISIQEKLLDLCPFIKR